MKKYIQLMKRIGLEKKTNRLHYFLIVVPPLIIFSFFLIVFLFVTVISGNTGVFLLNKSHLTLMIVGVIYAIIYLYFTIRRTNDIGISRTKVLPFLLLFIILNFVRIFPFPILITKVMYLIFIIGQLFILFTPPLTKIIKN